MRRLLNPLATYLSELARAFARGWDGFFFAPADPTSLGLIRIAVGLLLLWNLAMVGVDLRADLGSDGWAEPSAVREFYHKAPEGHEGHDDPRARSPYAWSFWLLVPDVLLPAAWAGSMAVLAMFTAGLGGRATAVLAWAVAASTARRLPEMAFGFDNVIATWALYLAVSGAGGQALSVDRWLARRRGGASGPPSPTVSANLGLRLIQLHLALIYGAAGLAKLRGAAWWDGSAMEMILLISDFRRFDLTWLAAYPTLLSLLTHGALAMELGYPILIWVRILRPLLVAGALLMHLGIDLTLGLTEFGLAMIAGNLAFVDGGWLRRLVPSEGTMDEARTREVVR